MFKVPFVKKAGLNGKTIIALFLLKIIAGLAIGFVAYQLTPTGNDYWSINAEGLKEYQLLLSNPYQFFTSIFHSHYSRGYGGFFDALPSYWNDLRATLMSKFLAPLNFLSGGNYYINSLFYNFFCFLGHVAFYRLFIQLYPNKKFAVIICCFLLPSMLYFSSGIQKDGIVFTSLGFLCFIIFRSLQQNKFDTKSVIAIFFLLLLLFLIRSYVPVLIAPSLTLWIITVKLKLKPLPVFVIGYFALGLLFFNLHFITQNFNPVEAVTKKQEAFFMLPLANTQVNIDTLQPNFKSFVKTAPQALYNSILRPHINDIGIKSLLPLIIETVLYQLIFILYLFFNKKTENTAHQSFIYAGLFFAATIIFFIGYIVPNLGSIVRYRSIYLIFIIAPIICQLNWQKCYQFIKIKK